MYLKPIFAESIILFKNIDLDHKKTLQYLSNLEFKLHEKNDQESKMSESVKILDESEYGNIIKKTFDKYIDQSIQIWGYKTNHQIINSWASETKPNCYSHLHRHQNFWLTTVYYPYSINNFAIEFESDRFDMADFDVPIANYNTFNNRSFTQEVGSGDLIIFSAKLKHKIHFNNTNEIRYSLATNILPKGTIGSRDSLLVL